MAVFISQRHACDQSKLVHHSRGHNLTRPSRNQPTPHHDVHPATGLTTAETPWKVPRAKKSASPRPRRTSQWMLGQQIGDSRPATPGREVHTLTT